MQLCFCLTPIIRKYLNVEVKTTLHRLIYSKLCLDVKYLPHFLETAVPVRETSHQRILRTSVLQCRMQRFACWSLENSREFIICSESYTGKLGSVIFTHMDVVIRIHFELSEEVPEQFLWRKCYAKSKNGKWNMKLTYVLHYQLP